MIDPEKTAYIIGNGGSREGFDLMLLKGRGVEFGCNALYRDFVSTNRYALPDYLVADNKFMILDDTVKIPLHIFGKHNLYLIK